MIKHFDKNTKGRDFVVGDIHGCFDLLRDKLKEIDFNTKTDRLFSVGDMVDRGDKSAECVKWINKSWFHAVRSNHEQIAIEYCNGIVDKGLYIQNGGQWFIDLNDAEQKCFASLFEKLPIAIDIVTEKGLVGIVHAEQPFDDWQRFEHFLQDDGMKKSIINCCLWDRTKFEQQDKTEVCGIYKIIVGHSPVQQPIELGNVMYIDTGAVFCGNLTVVQI